MLPRRLRVALLLWLASLASPSGAQLPGDANCDGLLTEADREAVTAAIFGSRPGGCFRPDANRDDRVSAADLVAVFAGPRVTVVGVADSNGLPAPSLGNLEDGTTVYFRSSGLGFQLVVEAVPAPGGAAIGDNLLDSVPGDPSHRPDLQVQVDRPLGNGSTAVCDAFGVPAVSPPDYAFVQSISDAMNDLACRFAPASVPSLACTRDAFDEPAFLDPRSRAQFCLLVTGPLAFQTGETRVTVRVRDRAGKVGPAAAMLLQVENGPFPPTFTPRPPGATRTPSPRASTTATSTPEATPTSSVTRTPTIAPTATVTVPPPPTSTPGTPLGPPIVFFGIVGPDARLPPVTPGSTPDGVPVYDLPFGAGFSLVVEVAPGISGRSPGSAAFVEGAAPDLQIQVSRPLGNGSPVVCGSTVPNDGVPAINPPSFAPTSEIIDRLNDLGCRFLNGEGNPTIRICSQESACVFFEENARFGCVEPTATNQFCGLISQALAFPPGDTVVSARVLDEAGNPGPISQIVIRVP